MGTDLRARASLKKKGLIFSSSSTIEQVADVVIAASKGTPLEPITASGKSRDGISILFHPFGPPVDARAEGDEVVIDAETSAFGPGYHAFVVSALERAQSTLGLRWTWNDPTGYVENRNFGRLQATMAGILRQSSEDLVKAYEVQGDQAGLKLCMPDDFGAAAERDEVLTPLGPTTIQQLRQALSAPSQDFAEVAADLYVWWGQGFDGDFYRGLALNSLWNELRWATPLHDNEVQSVHRAVDWCIQALQLGADLPVSKGSITELTELLKSKDVIALPREDGIGYRRRIWTRKFMGWQLSMPGSLQPSVKVDDGVTFIFAAPGLDIRASPSSVPSDDARIRAGRYDGGVSVTEKRVGDQTITVRSLAKTFALGPETKVCLLTVTSSNPQMRELGERIGNSLTYVSSQQA